MRGGFGDVLDVLGYDVLEVLLILLEVALTVLTHKAIVVFVEISCGLNTLMLVVFEYPLWCFDKTSRVEGA